jgi:hypothetical protein
MGNDLIGKGCDLRGVCRFAKGLGYRGGVRQWQRPDIAWPFQTGLNAKHRQVAKLLAEAEADFVGATHGRVLGCARGSWPGGPGS